ncbi:MAG: TonB-dependent receptor [Stagnimonas sp.]|nr:TonB-dependent receptor [Stagnimonas sp.]
MRALRQRRLLLCLWLGTAAAQAQDSTDSLPVQTLPKPTAEAAPVEQLKTVELERVIVTGEKLGRSQQQTSSSVAVKTRRELEDFGIDSVSDAADRTANALASLEGQLSLRGVDSDGADDTGFGQPVISTYVDGVAVDSTAQTGNLLDLFDVEQVEILRGAQSTSQGRNALAGAIVVETREPTARWDFRTRLRYGQLGERQLAAAGGGPLGGGFRFRLVGDYRRDDGYIDNPTRNDPDWDARRDQLWRGKLVWVPDGDSGFSALATLGHARRDGALDLVHREAEADGEAAHRTDPSDHPRSGEQRSLPASLRLRQSFGPHFELSSTTGTIDTEANFTEDYDGTAEQHGYYDYHRIGRSLTEELRLNLRDWHGLTGLVGLYAGRFRDSFDYHLYDSPVLLSEVTGQPVGGDNIAADVDYDQAERRRAKNFAVFSEIDWAASERLTLTAGLRYDFERSELRGNYLVTSADTYVVPPEQLAAIGDYLRRVQLPLLPVFQLAGIVPGTDGGQAIGASYHALLPKVGGRYALTPALTVFLSYTEAYRAGGGDVDIQTGDLYSYEPEYTQTLETGLRAALWQGRLNTRINVYGTRWQDQQVRVPFDNGSNIQSFRTENAAHSVLYGSEFENNLRLGRFRLYANLGYAYTRFEDYQNNGNDYSGNRFVNAPQWTAGTGAAWRGAGGWFSAISYTFSSGYYTTPENDPDENGDARRLLDLRLGYEGRHWSVYGHGRNLLDQDYAVYRYGIAGSYSVPTGRSIAYGPPRLIGAQIEVRL